jgi:hypothetical protein
VNVGKKHGPFFALQTPIAQLTSQANLALAGPAVDKCPCIARVMKNAQYAAVLQRAEQQFSGMHARSDAPRPEDAFLVEMVDDTHRGTGAAKRLKVRSEAASASLGVDE